MKFDIYLKILLILFLTQLFLSSAYTQNAVTSKYGIILFGGATIPIADLKEQPSRNNIGIGLTGMYNDTKVNSFYLNISYNRVKAPDSIMVDNLPVEGITKFIGGVILNIYPSLNIPFIEAGVGIYYFNQYQVHYAATDNINTGPTSTIFTKSSSSKFGYTLGLGQRLPVDKGINAVAEVKFNHIPIKPVSKYYFELNAGVNYNF